MLIALALMSRIFVMPDGSGWYRKLSPRAPVVTREWPADEPSRWRIAPTVAYFTIVVCTAVLFAREDMAHLLGEDLLVTAGTLALLGLFFLGALMALGRR
jgi:hypothetical protein